MTWTVPAFKGEFPEFAETGDPIVAAALVRAEQRVDPSVWGEKADQGVAYLAAHLLAIAPYGQNARLAAATGTTLYNEEFRRLQREVAAGHRVI